MFLIGNELVDFDMSRDKANRLAFDKNVIYNKPIMESTFDYIFSHIGLANESSIDFPVLITEPLCNPNYSRAMISELMFECYQTPLLSYAVDSLVALYGSEARQKDCLIVQSGYQTSHVIPVLDGKINYDFSKRV